MKNINEQLADGPAGKLPHAATPSDASVTPVSIDTKVSSAPRPAEAPSIASVARPTRAELTPGEGHVDSPPPPAMTNEFSLEAIRLDPGYAQAAVGRSEQVVVPVDKPNKHAFFRIHPEKRIDVCLLECEEDSKKYLVMGAAASAIAEADLKYVTLYLWVDRQGNYGFWPAGLPKSDGTTYGAWESAHEACARAVDTWLRIRWNRTVGGYDLIVLSNTVAVDDPNFPMLSLRALVTQAFKGKIINNAQHPVLRRLRGEL